MNPNKNATEKSSGGNKDSNGKLEKIANAIDPAGTEVNDEEIMDPGAKTREFSPAQKNSSAPPSRPK